MLLIRDGRGDIAGRTKSQVSPPEMRNSTWPSWSKRCDADTRAPVPGSTICNAAVVSSPRRALHCLGRRRQSATRIQSAWRANRARRVLAGAREERREYKAALLLQRVVRGWITRRRLIRENRKQQHPRVPYPNITDEERVAVSLAGGWAGEGGRQFLSACLS